MQTKKKSKVRILSIPLSPSEATKQQLQNIKEVLVALAQDNLRLRKDNVRLDALNKELKSKLKLKK